MWFRLSANSSGTNSGSISSSDSVDAATAITPTTEPSRFEKFRRASFRRKSSSQPPANRKRSKSPHSILRSNKSVSIEEEDLKHDADTTDGVIFKNEVQIVLNDEENAKTHERSKSFLVPISDPKTKDAAKKQTLKAIKTDPPKRKFYKNFTSYGSKRQNSADAANKFEDQKTVDTYKESTIIDDTEDDTDDEDSDSSDSETEVETIKNTEQKPDNSPSHRGKEKILLTDPKFKNNRIEKSSSKSKVNDLEKRESVKRSRSSRKIFTPNVLIDEAKAAATANSNIAVMQKKDKKNNNKNNNKNNKKDNNPTEAKTQSRGSNNLNLQALVKFVISQKKFLNTDDFSLMRRKSISEAATTVFNVASSCKPIALKYATESVVAEAPKDHDEKASRNVVLVKKQNLKNSFCDQLNNNNSSNENKNRPKSLEIIENLSSPNTPTTPSPATVGLLNSVKRNSSNSSKSSGNFEDEAFYSCDEQEIERLKVLGEAGQEASLPPNALSIKSPLAIAQELDPKRKNNSPSLTSRMAAKINEKTSNYKNRRAAAAAARTKKRKNAAAADAKNALIESGDKDKNDSGSRTEFYRQISTERLHSTSITRQPSDRRPDAVNISLRSNGNTAHNSSDLQSSFHGTSSGGIDGNTSTDAAAQAAAGGIGAAGSSSGGTGGATIAGGTSAVLGGDTNAQDAEGKDARRERLHQQHQQNKSAPVSVNRSESYKERLSHKRNRNSRRKTSDPSLASRPNDDHGDVGLANSNYPASSNSSLSSGGGSESPSTSMEQVGGVATAAPTAHQHHAHHAATHHHHQHSHHDSFHGSIGGGSSNASFWSGSMGGSSVGGGVAQLTRQWNFESDEEDDLNEADWSSNVAAEMLAALTDAEKKRQEIINEIYQTERSHVRTLKLLERLFFGPLQESGVLSNEHLLLLFPPALLSLRELHSTFEQHLKLRRVEHNHVVNHVGDLLASMFDGQSGEELCEFAAQFCARQQIALEALKEKRRKDEQLQKILSKAESHKACRRLQLKDLLPTVLQRLTKYPLLFENLYKVTIRVVPENTSEAEAIQRALESSKKILVDVNQAVKTAEDAHKLQNIQRKLDKSNFDKDEFKNLDLTQYRLIHDGSLTMKKNPSIQLHGLLFENMIVLLTKQDDKYSLKYLHAARNTEVNNKPVSPIMSIDSETLVRQEAADKNSFFLIKTKTSQMLELRASSSSECKTWFKHISDAAEQYKPRSKNANHEPVDDPAIATLPHSNTKESLELTPDRPPPIAATATITTTPLAPLMPIATATTAHCYIGTDNGGVQLRNGRRESTPTSAYPGAGLAVNEHKQRLSHNELTPNAMNRSMSTRSCGEAVNNYEQSDVANGVTLRHTQSARQAAADDNNSLATTSIIISGAGNSKRDSASIVYSNNSNNTRTLMQSGPALVEPTAIQISISPAHTAEPVLTPTERLRRLDASIRDVLMEKKKIICDMFRLPVEHFSEIVDIAAMPEAPKDSADIALAAYAQVQSLTEVLNDYMQVTAEQEVLAAAVGVCDKCTDKQRLSPVVPTRPSLPSKAVDSDIPPPLPPPNKLSSRVQQQASPTLVSKLQTPPIASVANEVNICEDDDGYCEIDELRLPALPHNISAAARAQSASPPPPLPPPAGTFKAPPTPPPPKSQSTNETIAANNASTPTPELVKRQSILSADSIPEESADEVTKAMDDDVVAEIQAAETTPGASKESSVEREETKEQANTEQIEVDEKENQTISDQTESSEVKQIDIDQLNTNNSSEILSTENVEEIESKAENTKNVEENFVDVTSEIAATLEQTVEVADTNTDSSVNTVEDQTSKVDEQDENNDTSDVLPALSKLNVSSLAMVDNTTQTASPEMMTASTSTMNSTTTETGTNTSSTGTGNCAPSRTIQRANSLEPSVPCHALSNIVSTLNAQISLLLPKINERDIERERLRKENQYLRELLNAMHERLRVEAKLDTPKDITITDDKSTINDEIDISSSSSTATTSTSTPTPTTITAPAPTVTFNNDEAEK